MAVELTSPALGLVVGDSYTGPEEAWLLAEGYAKQAGYTGPGVSNTGPATSDPSEDLTLASNREDPTNGQDWDTYSGRLDPAISEAAGNAVEAFEPAYDFDLDGVNDEPPALSAVLPESGAVGDTVSVQGEGLEGSTAVTFGGTAATSFEVVSDVEISAVVPAGTGAVDIVVTNPNGSGTLTASFTYA